MQNTESTAIWRAHLMAKNCPVSGKSGAADFGPFGVVLGRFGSKNGSFCTKFD
jgi:hypothetical protein